MKNKFSLFEKISFTVGIINALMFIAGFFIGTIWGNEELGLYLILPFGIQFAVSIILVIFVEFILNWIWGLDIHIFPTIFKG